MIKYFSLLSILFVTVFCGCREDQAISKEKFSEEVDSLSKFEFMQGHVSLKYQIQKDSLKRYITGKSLCKLLDKEVKEVTAAFFRDSFSISRKPVLYVGPSYCELDKCLPQMKFNPCGYFCAYLTGYTDPKDVSGARGLLKNLIASESYSKHNDTYVAKFKLDCFLNFNFNVITNALECEVIIDTRVYLKIQNRKNPSGKWVPADKSDNFKKYYEDVIKTYFNTKLKTYYHFLL